MAMDYRRLVTTNSLYHELYLRQMMQKVGYATPNHALIPLCIVLNLH